MLQFQNSNLEIIDDQVNNIAAQTPDSILNAFSAIFKGAFRQENLILLTWISMFIFTTLLLALLLKIAIQTHRKSSKTQKMNTGHEKAEKIKPLSECPVCGNKITLQSGKHNFYWHCTKCNYNQKIIYHCPECRKVLSLKKEEQQYIIFCPSCNLQGVYYTEKDS